jgi:hypothetical protein
MKYCEAHQNLLWAVAERFGRCISANRLSDGVTISRLIKQLLDGLAPGGRVLLFLGAGAIPLAASALAGGPFEGLTDSNRSTSAPYPPGPLLSEGLAGDNLKLNFDNALGYSSRRLKGIVSLPSGPYAFPPASDAETPDSADEHVHQVE